MKTKLVLCVMITLLLMHCVTDCNVNDLTYTITSEDNHRTVTEYIMHSPISIIGNSDFYGWPGSGTKENPYIIQGRDITSSSVCIEIISTTAYFEIRNCRISADGPSESPGIHFQDVTHGSVINCIIDSHEDGILVEFSSDCTLIDNIVTSNSQHGLYLYGTENCILMSNIASSNSQHGIYVYASFGCTLINNTATDNVDGFYLSGNLGSCMFMNNTAIDNRGDGVYISDCDSCNLTNNVVIGSDEGFVIWSSSTCILTSNTAINNSNTGFFFYGSSGSILTNNAATGSQLGFDFYLTSSCTLINNSLMNTGLVIRGTSLSHWLHNMSNNRVNDKPLGYFRNINGVSIDADTYGQVILANCFNVTIQHAVVNNAPIGFQVGYSTSCRLTNNTSNGSRYGFYLWGSTNCILSDNIASNSSIYGFYIDNAPSSILMNNSAFNSGGGFRIEESEYCNLTSNTAIGNLVKGFYLHWSDNCILMNNIARNSEEGIETAISNGCELIDNIATDNGQGFVITSDDTILTNNTASSNLDEGFCFISTSYSCTLTNNTATNNSYGFYLYGFPSSILTNNTASNNSDDGFCLLSSGGCALTDNTASNNSDAGIYLQGSQSSILVNNTFVNNGLVISGSNPVQWLHGMSGNLVNDRPLGYFRDLVGTSIDAAPYGQVILANCMDVIIEHAAVNNATVGILLGHSTNCTFSNNTATAHSDTGFRLMYSEGCTLANNTATNNANYGFYIHSSTGCALSNNTAFNNDAGIHLYASLKCILVNNTFVKNGLVIGGSSLSHWLHSLSDNWINDRPLGYFRDLVGTSIDANPYGQVILANCSEVTIQEGAVSNATVGFLLGYCKDCRLTDNIASNNKYGFYLQDSTGCLLTNNTASSNSDYGFFLHSSISCHLNNNIAFSNLNDGFYIYESDICNLSDNRATANLNNGFYLYGSDNCILTNNTATQNSNDGFTIYGSNNCIVANSSTIENDYGCKLSFCYRSILTDTIASSNYHAGFHLYDLFDSIFTNNTATDNSEDGVFIDNNSNNCTLIDNIITGNLNTGIHLGGGSSGNYIYYNVIEENGNNAWDDGSSNIWDDEVSIGNYWGDFDGGDFYAIPGSAESMDRYPFSVDAYLSVALDHPEDIEYESGTTGHTIMWHPSDPYPDSYEILGDGSQVVTDSWNGTDIGIDIDGLSVGVHNYMLIVYDTSGRSASDTVFVVVIDTTSPNINHPDDIQYLEGTTNHAITWIASDLNPEFYEVYRNGSIIASGIWNISEILLEIDGLSVGIHNFTAVVSDTGGNIVSDTVLVTVISSDSTTSTTTTGTTSTTTTTTHQMEGLPLMLYIAGFAASVGIVLFLIIVYIKKRR